MICDSIGIASVESPGDISLCTKHYQQVYRMLNVKSDAYTICRDLRCNCNSSFAYYYSQIVMYRLFMQYISDHDIELSSVCVSKSRLLTFIYRNELGELITSTNCTNKSIGNLFHDYTMPLYLTTVQFLHKFIIQTVKSIKLVNHQKSLSDDQSMKLGFDV